MNDYYEIQFNDNTVIWTKYLIPSTTMKVTLTPRGVDRLKSMFPNTKLLRFKCNENELNNVVNKPVSFFRKASAIAY